MPELSGAIELIVLIDRRVRIDKIQGTLQGRIGAIALRVDPLSRPLVVRKRSEPRVALYGRGNYELPESGETRRRQDSGAFIFEDVVRQRVQRRNRIPVE